MLPHHAHAPETTRRSQEHEPMRRTASTLRGVIAVRSPKTKRPAIEAVCNSNKYAYAR